MKKSLLMLIAFKVKKVIAESLGLDVERINSQDCLFGDLCDGMFDEAFLLDDLEKAFSYSFSEVEVDSWKNVGDVIDTVSQIPSVQQLCLVNQ